MLGISAKRQDVVDYFNLEKVPGNGGWFKLIHHNVCQKCTKCSQSCNHANSTTILRLVDRDTANPWHRLGATTIWSYLGGDPLSLSTYSKKGTAQSEVLGGIGGTYSRPLVMVKKEIWRQIKCLGEWTLSSCVCTPGFEFEDLEVAENGWTPV